MIGQRQDIGAASAKRGNCETQNIQPEIEIFAETAGFHGGGKIDVSEGDKARFEAKGFRSAEAFKRALLQNPKKFALRSGRERGDLIENDAAVTAQFEATELALDCAGESATFVAEKLAFNELRRKAGAIDFQERRVASRAKFMNQARKVVLAAAALARDHEGGGSDRDFLRESKKTL